MQGTLLQLLSDGQFHSGTELAAALGVSRTSVWKQISACESLGLDVHKVRGRGYLVPGGFELLEAEVVHAQMAESSRARFGRPQFLLETDSTNRIAMQASAARNHPFVCFAERQTAGRGRRGRAWVSPFACNLYMSFVQRFHEGFAELGGLSLVVGLAVVRALRLGGVSGVALKWPNDVVVGRKKLGGILIEVMGDATGECQAVVGIGLNVRMPGNFGKTIDQDWGNILDYAETPLKRNELASSLLNTLAEVLDQFETDGFGAFLSEWEQADSLRGKNVEVSGAERAVGTCLGVDEKGGLVLDTGNGIRAFYGGEVSLRRVSA